MTKAEKIIMDYTASWEWSQIEKLDWTTAEVMDIFDSYFKAQKAEYNTAYEKCTDDLLDYFETNRDGLLISSVEKILKQHFA